MPAILIWCIVGAIEIVVVLIIVLAIGFILDNPDKDTDEEDNIIICSVPWQKPIILRPDEFHSYEEAYSGIWEVTLRNGNLIYLPMEYTTILDNSMELTTL